MVGNPLIMVIMATMMIGTTMRMMGQRYITPAIISIIIVVVVFFFYSLQITPLPKIVGEV
jgi:hypothetical protein